MRQGLEREKVASSIQPSIVGALTCPANSPEKPGPFLRNRGRSAPARTNGSLTKDDMVPWSSTDPSPELGCDRELRS